ncbi:hypothetical protein BKA82DRAFT_4018924 [Pisolithus tinctorius]|nr:hypothetical protein BKA82DRAFT_4018924 [Pisolithus tinctorius]
MVFCGYPQLRLLLLRQDSIHFVCWDTNWDSLARFLTFLVNAAFSPLSIKTDVFSICPLYVLFDIYYARGTFGASPTKCQGLGALGSSQRLGAFKSHLGMDIPKLYLFVSQGYSIHFTSCVVSTSIMDSLRRILRVIPWLLTNGEEEPSVGDLPINLQYCALITIVLDLELSAVDAATLADILLSRSQHEAPSFLSSLAPSTLSSCQEGTTAVPFLPFSPISMEVPTPPISIHLTSADTPDSTTVLIHGHLDMEPRDPSLVDECWHTSTGVFFTVTL